MYSLGSQRLCLYVCVSLPDQIAVEKQSHVSHTDQALLPQSLIAYRALWWDSSRGTPLTPDERQGCVW